MYDSLIQSRKILSLGKGQVPEYQNGAKVNNFLEADQIFVQLSFSFQVSFHFKTVAIFENGEHDDQVVDDSRAKDRLPMELFFGKKFKFDLWEEWLKHMRIGEISQIELDWKYCQDYALLSKSFRNYCDSQLGNKVDDEAKFKRSNHCCGEFGAFFFVEPFLLVVHFRSFHHNWHRISRFGSSCRTSTFATSVHH